MKSVAKLRFKLSVENLVFNNYFYDTIFTVNVTPEYWCKQNLLLEKLHAYLLCRKEGIEEAIRIYPHHSEFLNHNQKNSYKKVRKEVLEEFLLLKLTGSVSLN